MSFDYYPSGCYGIRVKEIFPEELVKEMDAAYSAAADFDEELIASGFNNEGYPLFSERYERVFKHSNLADFEAQPGEFVRLAFAQECERYIPGYKKMVRFASFYRTPGDAMGADAEPDVTFFGVGVLQFPLEKKFKRARIPEEFAAKADMYLWVIGG